MEAQDKQGAPGGIALPNRDSLLPPVPEIGIDLKICEYIRKIALMAMGQEYAYNFIRKHNL